MTWYEEALVSICDIEFKFSFSGSSNKSIFFFISFFTLNPELSFRIRDNFQVGAQSTRKRKRHDKKFGFSVCFLSPLVLLSACIFSPNPNKFTHSYTRLSDFLIFFLTTFNLV